MEMNMARKKTEGPTSRIEANVDATPSSRYSDERGEGAAST